MILSQLLFNNGVTSDDSSPLGDRKLGAWSAVSLGRLILVDGGAVSSPDVRGLIRRLRFSPRVMLTCLVELRIRKLNHM